MEAMEKNREDLPYDTELPLFKFEYGLEYP